MTFKEQLSSEELTSAVTHAGQTSGPEMSGPELGSELRGPHCEDQDHGFIVVIDDGKRA